MTRTRRVSPPARAIVIAVQAPAGRACSAAVSLGVRARNVMKVMPRSVSSPSWVRVVAGHGLPVVGEGEDLVVLGGLEQVGVGVEQGVAVGVFGEERQDAAGALGS